MKVLESFWPNFNIAPIHLESAGDWVALQNLYSNLVEQDGYRTVSPSLAESWTRSTDGLIWKFKLRPSLRWSDGSAITAQQIVASLRRAMGGTTHTKLSEFVKSISTENGSTIEFSLEYLPENFLFTLAFVDLVITHPSAWVNGEFTWSAPTSGPYRYLSGSEDTYQIAANEFHWRYSSKLPGQVEFGRAEGDDSDFTRLMSGGWNACHVGAGIINAAQVEKLKGKFKVLTGDSDFLIAFLFSKKSPLLQKLDRKWRRQLLASVYNEFWANNPTDPLRATGLRPAQTKGALNYEEMDQIIRKMDSGKPSPQKIDLIVLKKHSSRLIFRQALTALEAVGMSVVVHELSPDDFKASKQNGDYDLVFQLLGASEGDPDSAWRIYQDYFYEEVVSKTELAAAQAESNIPTRDKMYSALETKALETASYIPLKNEVTYIVLDHTLDLDQVKTTDWGLKVSKLKTK